MRSTACLIHSVVLGASDCNSWKSVTAIGLLQRRQEGSYVHTVHKTRYGRSRAGSTHARSPRTCSPRTRPARHLHRVGQRRRGTHSNLQLAELGRVVAVAVLLERLEVLIRDPPAPRAARERKAIGRLHWRERSGWRVDGCVCRMGLSVLFCFTCGIFLARRVWIKPILQTHVSTLHARGRRPHTSARANPSAHGTREPPWPCRARGFLLACHGASRLCPLLLALLTCWLLLPPARC